MSSTGVKTKEQICHGVSRTCLNASVNDAACGFAGRTSLTRNGIPVPQSRAKVEQGQLASTRDRWRLHSSLRANS